MKKAIQKPFLPIILAPLILFSPLLLTGKALFWGTPSTQFIPWWDFSWSSLLNGQLPLWNPYLGMGAPLAANYQVGLFYPPYWLLFVIYAIAGLKWMAWGVTLIVYGHLVWSGIGTALLLKEMKAGSLAQTIGGLAYSLSGYLVARAGFLSINATASWLPWLLLLLIRLASKEKSSVLELTSLIGFILLAGHAQTAWYSLLLGLLWLIFWTGQEKASRKFVKDAGKALLLYFEAGLLAVGISAVQLLPTLEYVLNSQRAGEYGFEAAMTYSFWPWRLITLFIPDFFGNPARGNYWGYGNYWEDAIYIGLLPVLLALGFIAKSIWRKFNYNYQDGKKGLQNVAFFLAGIVLIGFGMALGDNTFVMPFLYRHIPTFNLFQAPTRWSLWIVISLSILAGLGVEYLERPAGQRKYALRLAAAGCLAAVVGAFLTWKFIEGIKPTFILSTAKAGLIGLAAVLLLLFLPEDKTSTHYRVWSDLVVVLVSLDLVLAGWGLNPGIDKDFYQKTSTEMRIKASRLWMPADVEYELKFDKFFRFDSFQPDLDWNSMYDAYLPNLGMLEGVEMVNNFDPILPGRYQKWMDQITGKEAPPGVLALMDVGNTIDLTEVGVDLASVSMPVDSKLRVVGCAKVAGSDQEALRAVMAKATEYYNNVVLSKTNDQDCAEGAVGSVKVISWKNGHLTLEAELDRDGWVFWSQTWYPGWQARIDGQPGYEVVAANYLFQTVSVPVGLHQVEFIYRPASYIWGAGVSALSLIVWCAWLRIVLEEKRRSNQERTLA